MLQQGAPGEIPSSLHFDVPIVGYIGRVERDPELIRFLIVIRLGGNVDHDGLFRVDALPSVIDLTGNLHQHGIVDAQEKFVDLTFGGRSFPRVIED
jgi:hypothetical protein